MVDDPWFLISRKKRLSNSPGLEPSCKNRQQINQEISRNRKLQRQTTKRKTKNCSHTGYLEHLGGGSISKPHQLIEALKKSLMKAWNAIHQDIIDKAVDDFPKRLKKCIEA
uniref:Uncharacterized protein n=1 Tax=Acrobeloides nanus TaxID=290746 RepID=A0A914ECW9_9BILA